MNYVEELPVKKGLQWLWQLWKNFWRNQHSSSLQLIFSVLLNCKKCIAMWAGKNYNLNPQFKKIKYWIAAKVYTVSDKSVYLSCAVYIN